MIIKIFQKKIINFNMLPTKSELLVWKNSFKHMKFKYVLSMPYYFLKRIIFLNTLFVKNTKFPYSIGSKFL